MRGGREEPGRQEAPPGRRGPNPTLYLPGLKQPSASLLLSPSPDTQRPPPGPGYGGRRGPIPAPLAFRLPALPGQPRQQRRRYEGRRRPPPPGLGPDRGRRDSGALGASLHRFALPSIAPRTQAPQRPPHARALPHPLGPPRAPPGAVPPPFRRRPAPAHTYPDIGGQLPAAPARDPT